MSVQSCASSFLSNNFGATRRYASSSRLSNTPRFDLVGLGERQAMLAQSGEDGVHAA